MDFMVIVRRHVNGNWPSSDLIVNIVLWPRVAVCVQNSPKMLQQSRHPDQVSGEAEYCWVVPSIEGAFDLGEVAAHSLVATNGESR